MKDPEIRALASAMREVVAEPVVPTAFADRVGQAYRQRLRRRIVVTLVVALILAVAAFALPALGAQPLVGVTAEVVADPGEQPYACRPVWGPPESRGPGGCIRVPVSGVDLGALAERVEYNGRVTGRASLVGRYWSGTFHVFRQGPPGAEPALTPPAPLALSCAYAVRHVRSSLCDALDDSLALLHPGTALLTTPVLARAADGAPMVAFDVVVVTDEVAEVVARYPAGLVRPRPWLRPV